MDTTLHRRLVLWAVGVALAIGIVAVVALPASAGPLVDPDTLTPPPLEEAQDVVCQETGQYIICDYFIDRSVENEPVFTLSCGTVYLTAASILEVRRWYSSEGLLVKRHTTSYEHGTLSLSPTGAEPTLKTRLHDSEWTYFEVPGDAESGSATGTGNGFRIVLPGSGGMLHIAGQGIDGEQVHGVGRDLITDDEGNVTVEEQDEALCAALQP
jgi:hypothetical protein